MAALVPIPLDLFEKLGEAGLDVDAILRRARLPRSRCRRHGLTRPSTEAREAAREPSRCRAYASADLDGVGTPAYSAAQPRRARSRHAPLVVVLAALALGRRVRRHP